MDFLFLSGALSFFIAASVIAAGVNALCLLYVVHRWQAHVQSLHADGQHSGMYFVDSESFTYLPYEVRHSPLAKLGTHRSGMTYFDVLFCFLVQSLPVASAFLLMRYLWCIGIGLTIPKQTPGAGPQTPTLP